MKAMKELRAGLTLAAAFGMAIPGPLAVFAQDSQPAPSAALGSLMRLENGAGDAGVPVPLSIREAGEARPLETKERTPPAPATDEISDTLVVACEAVMDPECKSPSQERLERYFKSKYEELREAAIRRRLGVPLRKGYKINGAVSNYRVSVTLFWIYSLEHLRVDVIQAGNIVKEGVGVVEVGPTSSRPVLRVPTVDQGWFLLTLTSLRKHEFDEILRCRHTDGLERLLKACIGVPRSIRIDYNESTRWAQDLGRPLKW